METNIVVDIPPPVPYLTNSGSQVMDQNSISQSNCKILQNVISQES